MKYFIGIDLGTSNLKGIVTDEQAKVLFERSVPQETFHPHPGFAEQDPELILRNVWELLDYLYSTIPPGEIINITFSNAMHSIMAVDKDGLPLTKLLTWNDNRAIDIANRFTGKWHENSLAAETGTPLHAMLPVCKIAWWRLHEPGIFSKAYKFISLKEYIFYQLTDQYVVDHATASATGMYHVHEMRWHQKSLELCGISPEQLSTPVPVSQRFTLAINFTAKNKEVFKHPPFIIGGSDGLMANLGCGASGQGEAVITIGTSGALRSLSRQSLNDHGQLFHYRVADHLFLNGGATNNGGQWLYWFFKTFTGEPLDGNTLNEYFTQMEAIEPGAGGLICLPYLFGERAPVWDAAATGCFINIQGSHGRMHFFRAMIEGICFSMKKILELLEKENGTIHTIYGSGSLVKSPIWMQLMADILGKKILSYSLSDASALGAVFLGMHCAGRLPTWENSKSLLPEPTQFLPGTLHSAIYDQNFSVYSQLYDTLKEIR